MTRPAVSVAILTHNRAELLREAMASVLAQTLTDFELIVLDDGSTDATPEVVKEFDDQRIIHISLEHRGHLSRLRNLAIDHAKGDYLAFLDSDDLCREGRLEAQMSLLLAHPDAGWSVCGYEEFDQEGTRKTRLYDELRTEPGDRTVTSLFPPLIRTRTVVYTSTVFIRMSALERTGRFNEELGTSDFEFFCRLAHAWPAALAHQPLVRIRKHDGNSSHGWRMEGFEEAIFSVERFHGLGAISDATRVETLLRLRLNLGEMLEREGAVEAARREYRTCLRLSPEFEPARRRLS